MLFMQEWARPPLFPFTRSSVEDGTFTNKFITDWCAKHRYSRGEAVKRTYLPRVCGRSPRYGRHPLRSHFPVYRSLILVSRERYASSEDKQRFGGCWMVVFLFVCGARCWAWHVYCAWAAYGYWRSGIGYLDTHGRGGYITNITLFLLRYLTRECLSYGAIT